jgi:hypothetical protein
MEEAQARRLQPHFVRAFFLEAFPRLGGRIVERECGRYEVTRVPRDVQDRDRLIGLGAPVLSAYSRTTFEREHVVVRGQPPAALLAPGHPLLDAVVDLTIERHSALLRQGAVLADRGDVGETPRLLVALRQEIGDGHEPSRTVSRRFDFVEIDPSGAARAAGPAPYLDYSPLTDAERALVTPVLDEAWLTCGVEGLATALAVEHGLAEHLSEVRDRVLPAVARTRAMVRQRLIQEINYWDTRHAELLDDDAAGRQLKIRPETAERRARDLERRLAAREAELAEQEHLVARPPVVAGGALVIPQGLLDRLAGQRDEPVTSYARETAAVERRAVDAVLAAERALGREPEEMAPNNPGFDVRSRAADARTIELEVKGRVLGAEDFQVTRTEVLRAKNVGERFRLALVAVHPDGPDHDEVRYIVDPFRGFEFGDFTTAAVRGVWAEEWARGQAPC